MRLPQLPANATTRDVTDVFRGYNRALHNRDGEFRNTQNLTTAEYPNLKTRNLRVTRSGFTNLQAIIAKDALYWVDNGTLYANGSATGLTGLQTAKPTQLVSMGAYICVFPDARYINTKNLSEYGDMGAVWTPASMTVVYTMCHTDGTIYDPTAVSKGTSAPDNPEDGKVWIDTSSGSVKEYSVYTQSWTVIETVYTRLDFTTEGAVTALFKELDGVNVSGAYFDDLNGSKILYAVGQDATTQKDYIVLVGLTDSQYEQTGATIQIKRTVPQMDYVCECQNRLWGCRYGYDQTLGETLNELYCCALGDFKNWEQYLGVSTDSWRASCGSDGAWTGCINYLGKPVFFKEEHIHEIYPAGRGHTVNDMPARGVQQGSANSLAVVGETLYYKARTEVMGYQGGMPVKVSDALGDVLYGSASAGVYGDRYYISMKDKQNAWHLFVYDAAKGLWMREDNLHAVSFARLDDELYCIADNKLVGLNGTDTPNGSTILRESALSWFAETGLRYYEQRVKGSGAQSVNYVSRYDLRMSMSSGAEAAVYVEYDSDGVWRYQGTARLTRTGSFVFPVRPRRCDHFRVKLSGSGDVRILSAARVFERGSDVV